MFLNVFLGILAALFVWHYVLPFFLAHWKKILLGLGGFMFLMWVIVDSVLTYGRTWTL